MSYKDEKHKEIAENLRLSVEKEATEETVKIRLIQPFFNKVLGWPLDKIVGEYVVGKDKGEKVDYALLGEDGKPEYLIEAKSPSKNLNNFVSQLIRYMKLSGVKIGFLTNGEKYEVVTENEGDYRITNSFQIDEYPLEYTYKESNKIENLSPKGYFEKVTSRIPDDISEKLSTVLALQPLSRQDNPLHIGFIIDGDIIRDFYNMYRNLGINITTIKQTKEGYEINIKKESDIIVIYSPYENDLPIETIMREKINIKVDEGSGMPENIPLLVISSPESNLFDEYTPISEQLPFSAFELSNLHFTKIVVSQQDGTLNGIETTENCDRIYVEDFTLPKFTTNIEEDIKGYYEELCQKHSGGAVPITSRENQAMKKFSQLKTLAENEEEIKTETVEYVYSIIKYGLREDSIKKYEDEIDPDNINSEKATSEEQEERREVVQELIEDLEEEYGHEGVPITEVIEKAEEDGFNGYRVEEDIEKLAMRGCIIQPKTDQTVRTV